MWNLGEAIRTQKQEEAGLSRAAALGALPASSSPQGPERRNEMENEVNTEISKCEDETGGVCDGRCSRHQKGGNKTV